jgi:uncharacterized HAD superfamily protein
MALLVLDLDGVVCDIAPAVAARVSARFDVACHPATWGAYDLSHLDVPPSALRPFLEGLFADPDLYAEAPACLGAVAGATALAASGWRLVGVTARAPHLAAVTRSWLRHQGVPVGVVHHVPFGRKARTAGKLGAAAAIEDNAHEAERLAEVCDSWLLHRPYNAHADLARARRLHSWDDAVGRLCQLRLFAS